jgi:hypothetical protein
MKIKLIISLLMIAVFSGFWWYQNTAYICPVPLSYNVGNIAEGFSLTKEEAIKYAYEAEQVWEREVGRDLFVYDETADFLINFVFDNRQAGSNLEVAKRNELDKQKIENDQLINTVKEIQKDYEDLTIRYDRQRTQYETSLTRYNEKVTRYNDRGGAPSDVYAELEKEQASLSREMENLNRVAGELNNLVSELNRVQDKANRQIEIYNKEVEQYNKLFGYAHEFTQGDYRGGEINVYKFSNENELVAVLAHEFGHALGIGHVENESSLMYYLMSMTDRTPVLGVEDRQAFWAVCGERETLAQKLRSVVRDALTKF